MLIMWSSFEKQKISIKVERLLNANKMNQICAGNNCIKPQILTQVEMDLTQVTIKPPPNLPPENNNSKEGKEYVRPTD